MHASQWTILVYWRVPWLLARAVQRNIDGRGYIAADHVGRYVASTAQTIISLDCRCLESHIQASTTVEAKQRCWKKASSQLPLQLSEEQQWHWHKTDESPLPATDEEY